MNYIAHITIEPSGVTLRIDIHAQSLDEAREIAQQKARMFSNRFTYIVREA